MGHMGGLINPRPGRIQYRAGLSNTGGSPGPRKRAPCQKKTLLTMQIVFYMSVKIIAPYNKTVL